MLHGLAMKERYKNIIFVVPDPKSFISGGNIYNLYFLDALRQVDPIVSLVDFDTFKKINTSPQEHLFFIDTYYFDAIKTYQGDLSSSFLLVHLLESLNEKSENRLSFFKKEEKKTLDRFQGFLSTSDFTKNYVVNLGYEDKAHLVIPPAIGFKPQRRKKHSEKIEALMVNNLMERKGIIELLEAIEKTEITAEQFHLTIIGNETIEPEYAEACKKIFNRKRLKVLVTYRGVMPHTKVKKFYQKSNLYISSAYMETFGISLQEAVAYRTPILAFDGGNSFYHIEKGQNGFLFNSNKKLVDKILHLCENKKDFEKLLDTSWQFRKFEKYNWKEAVTQFVRQLATNLTT